MFQTFANDFQRNFIADHRWRYLTNGLAVTLEVTFFAVLLGVAPWILLGVLAVGVPVYKHIQQFKALQEKKTTFALAIKNMVMIHSLQAVLLFVAVLFFN